MEMTRRMGAMKAHLGGPKPPQPLRQNTFVVEDRNVMRLGGEEENRMNNNNTNGHRNGSKSDSRTNKPTTGTPLANKMKGGVQRQVITSKTDSGLGQGDGEWIRDLVDKINSGGTGDLYTLCNGFCASPCCLFNVKLNVSNNYDNKIHPWPTIL